MKVLFVDDEKIIREGIKDLIDWEAIGCKELRLAANAQEAIEMLDEYLPDLVITDIYMQEMTGIELAKYLKLHYPNLKVIILSGYESFPYAREAIEAGVLKYLLKPILPDELEEAVIEAKQEINKQLRRQNKVAESEKVMSIYQPIMARTFWKELIRGELTGRENIFKRAQLAGVVLPKLPMTCIYAARLNTEKNLEQDRLLYFILQNVIEKVLGDELVDTAELDEGQCLSILTGDISAERLDEIYHMITGHLDEQVCLAVGCQVKEVEQLSVSAASAQRTISFCRLVGRSGVLSYEDLELTRLDSAYPKETERKIVEMIRFQDKVDTDLIHQFTTHLLESSVDFHNMKVKLFKLMSEVYRIADELKNVNLEPFYKKYLALSELKQLNQIENYFNNWFEQIIYERRKDDMDDAEKLVQHAKMIIEQEFDKESFSVNDIVCQLHVSSSYFSRIFRKQTGKTCIDYITGRRIEEAKKMLRNSNMKQYQVAAAVGYANVYYFGVQFKKVTGETPGNYRKRMVNEDAENH